MHLGIRDPPRVLYAAAAGGLHAPRLVAGSRIPNRQTGSR